MYPSIYMYLSYSLFTTINITTTPPPLHMYEIFCFWFASTFHIYHQKSWNIARKTNNMSTMCTILAWVLIQLYYILFMSFLKKETATCPWFCSLHSLSLSTLFLLLSWLMPGFLWVTLHFLTFHSALNNRLSCGKDGKK